MTQTFCTKTRLSKTAEKNKEMPGKEKPPFL
jgi:hypothetical protein